MRLNNYIAKSIREYPKLFRDVTYEKSRVKVLDQLFLTNGNGMEWRSGQIADRGSNPRMRRNTPGTEPRQQRSISCSQAFEEDYFTREMVEKLNFNGFEFDSKLESRYEWNPYPICQHAKIANVPDDVCPDWLAGAREIYHHTVKFFEPSYEEIRKYWRYMQMTDVDDACVRRHVDEQRKWLRKIDARLSELELR
jgi:hypothetical protein